MKQTLRYLMSQWKLSLTMVLTLGLGIGATTAVYSLIHGFLLRPLPYGEAERLVKVETYAVRNPGNSLGISYVDGEDIRQKCRLLAGLGTYSLEKVNLLSGGGARTIEVGKISSGLFRVLGVNPQLGREFLDSENQPGGAVRKAILSDRLWRERFGGDPGVLGKTVRTAMNSYEVVGVMPAGFAFPANTELWITEESALALRGTSRLKEKRAYRWAGHAVARLAVGAKIEAAQAELGSVSEWIAANFADENREVRHRLVDLRAAEVGALRPYLLMLGVAVVMVMGVCCFNLAGLMLAQATGRVHEFVVRAALGARLGDLVRQLLAESVVVSVAGLALGIGVAAALLAWLPGMVPVALPFWIRWDLSGEVLLVAAGLGVGCAMLFALAPLRVAMRAKLQDALRSGARTVGGKSVARAMLVVAEVAACVVLLVSAGWMVESFTKLMQTDTGFERESILTFNLSPYRPGEDKVRIRTVTAYYEQVLNRIREVPGVVAVGGTDNFPFTGNRPPERTTLNIEARGDSAEAKAVRAPATFVDVSPGYFEAMGIPLVEGRDFSSQDDLTRGWVIILSQKAARTLFGDQPALGQQVRAGSPGNWDPYATVVGVVGNVKYSAAEKASGLEFYYPYKQYGWGTATIAVRAAGDRAGLENQVRAAVASVDAETPLNEMQWLNRLVDNTLWQPRLWSVLLTVFAGVALLLALIGIYGLVSFSVSVRTREMGIRAALGATPGELMWLVSREGLGLVGMGMALAVPGCWAAAMLAQGLLFETSPFQPQLYLGVMVLLAGAGLLASLVPAWRAARLDPVEALRLD